ncbi:GTP-binding protein [Leptothoe kymatousa]|uniref:GTP-binding protein n=1 Tax=Leptothoe kymatousa TAU-MAC 1615 TaxID=2364775 RepID=A0ABS5Y120_9CYAN|nr:GTP-binding protein [Leptothoe kymatousa]MBT9310705.1 GTP-binding protein [Leptothoe kymatousa TAU-MAC 1615]
MTAPSNVTHLPDFSSSPESALERQFERLMADSYHTQAQSSLKQVIDGLDLTPREREGLQPEIDNLLGLQKKIDQGIVHIAVFGMVGRGKSSLLNALVGQPIFVTGPLHGVTQDIASVDWQVLNSDQDAGLVSRVTLANSTDQNLDAAARIELIDTPGIDEVDGEQRQQLAERVAQQSDLILFVIAADLTQVEYDALAWLRQAGKPILLVLNKADQYAPPEQALLLETLGERVKPLNILADDVVVAAAAPLQITVADGARRRTRGLPDVAALKLKMLDVLAKEGKALIALNTLLYMDDVQTRLVERKLQIRQHRADDLIWQTALTKSIAVAVNPMLLADVVGGVAVDVGLVVSLSKLYGLPMTQQESLHLLKTIAIATGSLSVTELFITLGLSSLKSLLGMAGLATGGISLAPYVSVALTQAAVAGVATYAIGQVTRTYLVNGASWGEQGPKATIANIVETLDEASIMARLKDELRQKLHRNA